MSRVFGDAALHLVAARDATAAQFVSAACSSAPTTAPSPMAAPTRLTDPDRTSPEANTLRTLVSSGSGRPDPLFDRRVSRGTSDPVRMKFLPSKATPLSLSQPVAGFAPMKQKAPIASTCRNHDRRRLHAPAIIEMERNRHFREVEARYAAGYHHPGTKFLRLDVSPAGERPARNAGQESRANFRSARSPLPIRRRRRARRGR